MEIEIIVSSAESQQRRVCEQDAQLKILLVVLNLLFNIFCTSDSNHSVSQCLYKPSDKFVHVLITILY